MRITAYAKRQSWTRQVQVVTRQLTVAQSDAIREMQSVPQSLAAILRERKERTKLGLRKYTAEAAEQAAESGGDLRLAPKVRDVAAVHSTLWPAETGEGILDVGLLVGKITPALISVDGQRAGDNRR